MESDRLYNDHMLGDGECGVIQIGCGVRAIDLLEDEEILSNPLRASGCMQVDERG